MGRYFDARRWFAAIHASAPRRKHGHIASPRDQARHAHWIETRCVHETQPLVFNRLCILINLLQARLPALGNRPQALLENRRQPPLYVAERWIVIDRRTVLPHVILPPMNEANELLADLAG